MDSRDDYSQAVDSFESLKYVTKILETFESCLPDSQLTGNQKEKYKGKVNKDKYDYFKMTIKSSYLNSVKSSQ